MKKSLLGLSLLLALTAPAAENVAGREQRAPEGHGMFARGPVNEWVDVTWDEVMQRRRERQAKELVSKRYAPLPNVLPCYVQAYWWHRANRWACRLVTRHFEHQIVGSPRRYQTQSIDWALAESIMREQGFGLLPLQENFYPAWIRTVARRYPHPTKRKTGMLYGWYLNRSTFSLNRPPL